jgi:glutamine cyclotransferase
LECFESTGEYGSSSLRRVDVGTGKVLQLHNVDSRLFGEGVTHYIDESGNTRLIQLTWVGGVVLIYDAETFQLLEERVISSTTSGEGWGICHVAVDGIFYVTDGTAFLHKWNMTTLELIDKVPVTLRETVDGLSQERDRLNEIEYDYHSRTILSNVWYQDFIVRIDPQTGFITYRYDFTSLADLHRNAGVLNGIAVTGTPNEILATGKNWTTMYRIRLIDEGTSL